MVILDDAVALYVAVDVDVVIVLFDELDLEYLAELPISYFSLLGAESITVHEVQESAYVTYTGSLRLMSIGQLWSHCWSHLYH